MKLRKLISVAAAVGTALSVGQAQASFTFDALGESTTIFYVKTIDGADLNATVKYTLLNVNQNVSGDTAQFKVDVQNNTLAAEPGTNVLMSFSIKFITPTLTAVTDDSGVWDAATGVNFPSAQQVAFCGYRSNNCAGGNVNNGLGEASPLESFNVTMTFSSSALDNFGIVGATTLNSVAFDDPFHVKFQSVGNAGDSWEFSCPNDRPNCDGGGPPALIPEPSTLALLGLGLLGGALVRRRALPG